MQNKIDERVRNISFFLQDISPLINKIAFQNFFDLIIITAKCFPEISIIVKEHPSSILKSNLKIKLLKQKNIILHPSHSNKLNEILDISDITLSIFLFRALAFIQPIFPLLPEDSALL